MKIKLLFMIIILLFSKNILAAPGYTELLLEVSFNQEDLDRIALFLETPQGELWADEDEVKLWRLRLPKEKPIFYEGHNFYPLKDFKGLKYKIDKLHMSIQLQVPANIILENQIVSANTSMITPENSKPGAFLNYNATAQRAPGQTQASGIFEGGFFSPHGVGVYNELVNLAGPTHKAVRLTTTWTKDMPQYMNSIRVGDDFNVPGMWGQSTGFGGFQWGTNFATQPYFIPFPLPSLRGEATIPTTLDVFVNNALVTKTNVPSGPFSITNIPTLTGLGNINLITTDLLGHQQVVNLPFYSSSTLLKKGLHNYSYEIGFVRNNFGINSNDYTRFMITATDDLGITENFTREWHLELLYGQQSLGLGGNFLWKTTGVFSAAAAVSHAAQGGPGGLLLVGFQRQTLDQFSFGFNSQLTSRYFVRLGIQPGTLSPIWQNQVFANMPLRNASLGMSYAQQKNRDNSSASFLTVTYNNNITKNWSLNITTLTNIGGVNNKSIFLTLTHPLDERTAASVGGIGQAGNSQATVNVQRALPTDEGFGYNLYAARGSSQTNYQAILSAQNYVGNYSVVAAHQANETGYQLNVYGAIALLDGHFYLSRALTDSFGVAQVPGYPYVNVYVNNQVIAKTDKNGNALLPNLLAYNKNSISINPHDLPLTAEIGTDRITAIPYYRSGLVIAFPVHPAHDALMRVVFPSGQPLPPGTLIHIQGQDKTFPVAGDGSTYISGLEQKTRLIAQWGEKQCAVDVLYTETKDPLPHLGTVVCKSVA